MQKEGTKRLKIVDNIYLKQIKKEQVTKIRNSIVKIVSDNKDYYKDKEYAKPFMSNKDT